MVESVIEMLFDVAKLLTFQYQQPAGNRRDDHVHYRADEHLPKEQTREKPDLPDQ